MSEPVHRLVVYFEGNVQGVGFRYQTLQLAKAYEVTGCVRNEADGRVYLLAEGDEREVEDFYQALLYEMEHFIRSDQRTAQMGVRQMNTFMIQ